MNISEKIEKFNLDTQHIKFFSNKTMEDKFVYFIYENEQNLTFLEAGASNGIDNSTTYFLEKNLNWNGICIEPSICFETCKSNRKNVENVLLGSTNEEKLFCIFNDFNNELSCKAEELLELYKTDTWQRKFILNNSPVLLKIVEQKTMTQILEKYNINSLDFLSLDIERSELDALHGLDFDKFNINLITCENSFVVDFLKNKNYVQIYNPFVLDKCNWNTWFVNRQLLETKTFIKQLIID